jgi:hypothetical protein
MAFKMKGFPMQKGISPMKQKQDTDPRKSPEARKKAKEDYKKLMDRPDWKKNNLLEKIENLKKDANAEGRSLTDSEKKQIATLQAKINAL